MPSYELIERLTLTRTINGGTEIGDQDIYYQIELYHCHHITQKISYAMVECEGLAIEIRNGRLPDPTVGWLTRERNGLHNMRLRADRKIANGFVEITEPDVYLIPLSPTTLDARLGVRHTKALNEVVALDEATRLEAMTKNVIEF